MDPADIQISLDLVSAARRHLYFLDNVDNFEKLLNNDSLLELAVQRYEQLWLPLVEEYGESLQIEPPTDVGWMWYCHMLRPLVYRRDCRLMLKRTLSHSFPRKSNLVDGINRAIELWYEKYPKDGYNTIRNEEFIATSRKIGKLRDTPSKLAVKLPVISKSQIHFCYQVSLPHYRDREFLQAALNRYKLFLCLKRQNPDAYLTPPIDIELMWYTHMCYPLEYAIDTMKACGRVLENNLRIQIGSVTQAFRSANEETNKRWKTIANETLIRPGTKLRARETAMKIREMRFQDLKSCCVTIYKLSINYAELMGLPGKKRGLRVRLCLKHLDSSTEEVIVLKGSKRQRHWTFKKAFSYTTNIHDGMQVNISERRKLFCIEGVETLAMGTLKLTPLLESVGKGQENIMLEIEADAQVGDAKLRLLVDGKVEETLPQICNLRLLNPDQDFTDTIMGRKQLLETFGRSTLADNRQSHRTFFRPLILKNHEDEECFPCRIIHIPDQLLSVAQVFFYDRLMASAFVIGSSQLPLPTQVAEPDLSMAFDPEIGERAMLIRNVGGDWGLCIGSWEKDDEDERLKIRFTQLSEVKVETLEVSTAELNFQSFRANLHTGTIAIDPSKNTIPENIALVLSICVLHVLCAPENSERRIKSRVRTQQLQQTTNNAETQSIPVEATVLESSCALLLAAGLKTTTPNNEYILQHHESLSADITFDAQEVFIEEVKVEKSLFEQDSKVSESEIKQYRERLEAERNAKCEVEIEDTKEEKAPKKVKPRRAIKSTSSEDSRKEQTTNSVGKKGSASTEDTVYPSDGSLNTVSKDEMSYNQTKYIEPGEVNGTIAEGKVLNRKITKALEDELTPSEDSLDGAENEWKEFKGKQTTTETTHEPSVTKIASNVQTTLPGKDITATIKSNPDKKDDQTTETNITNKATINQISHDENKLATNLELSTTAKKESEEIKALTRVDIDDQNRKRKR